MTARAVMFESQLAYALSFLSGDRVVSMNEKTYREFNDHLLGTAGDLLGGAQGVKTGTYVMDGGVHQLQIVDDLPDYEWRLEG